MRLTDNSQITARPHSHENRYSVIFDGKLLPVLPSSRGKRIPRTIVEIEKGSHLGKDDTQKLRSSQLLLCDLTIVIAAGLAVALGITGGIAAVEELAHQRD